MQASSANIKWICFGMNIRFAKRENCSSEKKRIPSCEKAFPKVVFSGILPPAEAAAEAAAGVPPILLAAEEPTAGAPEKGFKTS